MDAKVSLSCPTESGSPAVLQPLVIFFHIAKAGGTSFHAAAEEMCKDRLYWKTVASGRELLDDLNAEAMKDKLLVGGHFSYGQFPFHRVGRPLIHLAIMRTPVERAISAYNFIRPRKRHPLHEKIKGKSLYEALCGDSVFPARYCNGQLRVLFGPKGLKSLDERNRILDTERYVIGKLEHLGDFMSYVANHIFGQPEPNIPHKNNSRSRVPLDNVRQQPDFDKAVQLLNDNNVEELAFYNSFDRIFVSAAMELLPAYPAPVQSRTP